MEVILITSNFSEIFSLRCLLETQSRNCERKGLIYHISGKNKLENMISNVKACTNLTFSFKKVEFGFDNSFLFFYMRHYRNASVLYASLQKWNAEKYAD